MSDELKRIVLMAEQLLEAQEQVKRLTDSLAEAKKLQAQLEQEDLPSMMQELGFKSFALKDGRQLELVEDVQCGITEANHQAAMRWLDENNFGGLIKTRLEATFNRENRAEALELAAHMREEAQKHEVTVDPVVAESVHAATLKSFIKEQLAKGAKLPFDLFSIHPFNRVKIKK